MDELKTVIGALAVVGIACYEMGQAWHIAFDSVFAVIHAALVH